MIVVDTSVWVTALRSAASREATVLDTLLDADEVTLPVPVRVELLSGASNKDRPALRRGLSALPLLFPTDETWNLIDSWIERAGRAGERFGIGDVLIAALAREIDALVWSLDADFKRMAQQHLIELYDPPRMP
jgi:predicted nucleic acid-binding protein